MKCKGGLYGQMIYQWKEKCLIFHESAVVKVGGGHDFRKLRSTLMYVLFQNVCVSTKLSLKSIQLNYK